jgi:predicted hotdog family 3-hydroxylacyl-ACP dehydratase
MDTAIDIKNYLPHQAPMLMVDKFICIDSQYVETIFEIKNDNIFVQNNIFLEAGLIENAAQTCSSIVAQSYFIDENNQEIKDVVVIGFISTIKSIKIHNLPKVGDSLTTKAVLLSKFITDDYSLCTLSCETFNEDKLLLEGEINLFLQENISKK